MSNEFTVTIPLVDKETRGRPSSSNFEETSTSRKSRKLIRVEESFSEIQIQEARLRILRTSGRKSSSNLIRSILSKEVEATGNDSLVVYTADEALALIKEIKLTKSQYIFLYTQAKRRNA